MSYLAFLRGDKDDKAHPKRTNYDIYLEQRKATLRVKNQPQSIEVCTPRDFSEVEKLIDKLKKKNGCVVDFSSLPTDKSQRMIDFLVGAVYALDGKVERLTSTIYLMTPKGIDIIAKID